MDQASRQVEQLAPHAQNLRDFVISFLLLAPHLLAYTVPLAFLLAMIWTLEQMKQETLSRAIAAGAAGDERAEIKAEIESAFEPAEIESDTVQVKTIEEAMALPKGTIFIDPEGNKRRR